MRKVLNSRGSQNRFKLQTSPVRPRTSLELVGSLRSVNSASVEQVSLPAAGSRLVASSKSRESTNRPDTSRSLGRTLEDIPSHATPRAKSVYQKMESAAKSGGEGRRAQGFRERQLRPRGAQKVSGCSNG